MKFCKICSKTASFNILGKPPEYCSDHKSNEMINVKHKKCLECDKLPYFNYINEKNGLYCSEHAKENMINIKSKVCEFYGCTTLASFGIDKTPKFCSIHKQDNMYHVSHRCKEINCNKYPLFNFINKKTGIYCIDHKKPDMIDVTHKRCEKCTKTATFNFIGGLPKFCGEHKETDMVDVISKKCKFINCDVIPVYNYPNEKNGLYCNAHKLENMVDVKSPRCGFKDCYKRPLYNKIGEKKGLFCLEHKETYMVDVYNLRCKLCNLFIENRTKYEHYCINCYIHLYPDNKISKNFRTKERAVADYIRENFKEIDWFFDKKIEDGCSKRRPDIMCDLGKHILIVEIDEFQHKKYEEICENKRYMEISKDFEHRPIIFIRFNPDKYIKDNTTISSCWKEDKKGHLIISKVKEWNERLEFLKININIWNEKSTEKTLEIINLFFDQ
jgi:hypothetical protein